MDSCTIIDKIRQTFPLSSAELAQIIVCEDEDNKRRLYDFMRVVRDWNDSGYSVSTTELHRKLLWGAHSLFDVLKSPTIDREVILFVGSRIYLAHRNSGVQFNCLTQLKKESEVLDDKTGKLGRFIDEITATPTRLNVDYDQRKLLYKQLDVMNQYADILHERLNLIGLVTVDV